MEKPLEFDKRQSQRIAAVLFITQGMFSAGFILALTLLSVVAVDLSGSDSSAGVPGTILTFSRAGIALPLGILLDRIGRRNSLSLGYLVGIGGAAVAAIAIANGQYYLLLLGVLLFGAARAGADMSRFVAAEVYPMSQRASIIGTVVFAGTIGAVGGPLLVDPTSKLAESADLIPDAGPWIVAGILMGITMLITFVGLRPDPREIGRRVRDVETARINIPEAPPRPLHEIYRDSTVQLAFTAMLVGQVVMVMLMTITPVNMKHHDYGNFEISVVFMAHTLGMFGLSPITGRLIDRFGRVNIILSGAVILIAAAVVAPLSSQLPVPITSMLLLGVGWNFCFIGGTSLLSDALTTDERGRAQGLNDALVAGAAGLGSLSSGLIFDAGGFLVVSVVGLVLTLALTGMIGSLAPRRAEPAAT
jgi:MFS family permease